MSILLNATAGDATSSTLKGRAGRRVVRGAVVSSAVAALFIGMTGAAFAQPVSDDGSTDANVEVTSSIVLSGLTPSFELSGIPGATVETASIVDFNVETNNVGGYAVTVQSETANMAGTGANADVIPIGAVSVKESAGAVNATNAAYKALTTSAQQVHTQATRSASGGDALSNDFKVVIPFVNSDTYTATLDYVATTL